MTDDGRKLATCDGSHGGVCRRLCKLFRLGKSVGMSPATRRAARLLNGVRVSCNERLSAAELASGPDWARLHAATDRLAGSLRGWSRSSRDVKH